MTVFKILSLDGGGFRGLFTAHVLRRMEQEWGLKWHEEFGMFAGTSTGAILAAGLACGRSATRLGELYEDRAASIFKPRLRSRLDVLKIFTSRYSSHTLQAVLENEFGDTRLGDIHVPLVMPAVDIGNGCVHVLKSRYADGFVRDLDVRVSDAVLASCSAPTYFDPHTIGGEYRLADGGLWANNPSLVAAIDAHHRLGIDLADVRVLSIGTGQSKAFYADHGSRWKDWLTGGWMGWGFATGWQRSKLLDLVFSVQSESAHNMLCLLLGESPLEPNRVFRVGFESDRPLPMDAVRKRAEWITKADHVFTHNAERVREFLHLGVGS